MMKKTTIATERSDLQRLVSMAIKEANSESVSGVERCLDILRHLKSLRLASKDLFRFSREIHTFANLRNHGNPKIQMEADDLLYFWTKIVYAGGREAPQKPDVACSDQLKKRKEDGTGKISENPRLKRVRDVTFKYAPTRIHLHTTQTKLDVTRSKNKEDVRSQAHKTSDIQQKKLKKPDDKNRKSFTTTIPNQAKKKQTALKKMNEAEMLELFNIAKKSADVANAKGLLAAKPETSICVDTLALLMDFPISETDPETRKTIMVKLDHLTRHKDRRVCNSASALLQHWKQSMIKDQQKQGGDARKKSGKKLMK